MATPFSLQRELFLTLRPGRLAAPQGTLHSDGYEPRDGGGGTGAPSTPAAPWTRALGSECLKPEPGQGLEAPGPPDSDLQQNGVHPGHTPTARAGGLDRCGIEGEDEDGEFSTFGVGHEQGKRQEAPDRELEGVVRREG